MIATTARQQVGGTLGDLEQDDGRCSDGLAPEDTKKRRAESPDEDELPCKKPRGTRSQREDADDGVSTKYETFAEVIVKDEPSFAQIKPEVVGEIDEAIVKHESAPKQVKLEETGKSEEVVVSDEPASVWSQKREEKEEKEERAELKPESSVEIIVEPEPVPANVKEEVVD